MAAYEVFANENGKPVAPGVASYDAYGTLYGMSSGDTYSMPRDTTGTSFLANSTGGIGYTTGAGGAVEQGTSRTTTVVLNKTCGAITLFSAAGSTTAASFTVTNSTVAATDTIVICQKSGTDKYIVSASAVADGSFEVTFRTFSGTTTEQPVFNFAVFKAKAA